MEEDVITEENSFNAETSTEQKSKDWIIEKQDANDQKPIETADDKKLRKLDDEKSLEPENDEKLTQLGVQKPTELNDDQSSSLLTDDQKPHLKRLSRFVCQYCSKTFKKKASLNGHFRIHAGLIRYDCNLCSEQFSRVDDYLKHAKVHKKKEIFTCEVCSQTFVRRKKFLLHRTIHNPHVCYICMDSFPKAEELTSHLESHSAEKKQEDLIETNTCEIETQNDEMKNVNAYDTISWRTCQICSNSFQKKTNDIDKQPEICDLCLQKNNNFLPKSRNCGGKGRQSRRKRFTCNICFKTFNRRKTWTNHCAIHGIRSNLFHCRFCPESYTKAEDFILHGKTHLPGGENGHSKGSTESEVKVDVHVPIQFETEDVKVKMENGSDTLMNEEYNKCQFCSRIFDGKKSLSLHLRTHTRIYTCGFCSETFNRSDYYRNHLSKHSKGHDCDICYKTFPSIRVLKQHRLIHGESHDIHWCQICKKSFSQAQLLVNHMRIHSGERPYKCDLCSKTFAQMLHLQNHYRTHNLSKNFACKLCPKTYKLSQHLTNHMKIHNNTTPYECHYCFKSFTLGNNFRNHLRTHTGEKPFGCNICQEKFGTTSQLTVHKRTHNVETPPTTVEDIYSCYFCLRSFPTQEELSVHQKTHLNEMVVPISVVIEVNPATVMGNFNDSDVEEILGM